MYNFSIIYLYIKCTAFNIYIRMNYYSKNKIYISVNFIVIDLEQDDNYRNYIIFNKLFQNYIREVSNILHSDIKIL